MADGLGSCRNSSEQRSGGIEPVMDGIVRTYQRKHSYSNVVCGKGVIVGHPLL